MIWRAILGGLWKPLAWAFGFVAVWITARRSGTVSAEKRGLESYRDTRKAIDDVDHESIGDDPAILRDWLRERGQPKRGM